MYAQATFGDYPVANNETKNELASLRGYAWFTTLVILTCWFFDGQIPLCY